MTRLSALLLTLALAGCRRETPAPKADSLDVINRNLLEMQRHIKSGSICPPNNVCFSTNTVVKGADYFVIRFLDKDGKVVATSDHIPLSELFPDKKESTCRFSLDYPPTNSRTCWPPSPAAQFGVGDDKPPRCSEGFGESAIIWAARKDGFCYEKDQPKEPF